MACAGIAEASQFRLANSSAFGHPCAHSIGGVPRFEQRASEALPGSAKLEVKLQPSLTQSRANREAIGPRQRSDPELTLLVLSWLNLASRVLRLFAKRNKRVRRSVRCERI